MEDDQIEKLGSQMREVYADVATGPAPVEDAPKHPSRRLRKNRYVTRAAARSAPRRAAGSADGFVPQRPLTALLIAAGAGYLLARLSR